MVINVQNINLILLLEPIFVNPHNNLITAINIGLPLRRCLFYSELWHAAGNGLGHTAHLINFLDKRPSLIRKISSQFFHVIRTRQGIDHIGDARFFLQNQLGVSSDTRRKFRRQRNRFIKRIGMQRLRPPQNRAHRLISGAYHVVIGVLFLQADPRGLTVRAQHFRAWVFRTKLAHNAMPEQARRPQFSRFHKKVHANGKEER